MDNKTLIRIVVILSVLMLAPQVSAQGKPFDQIQRQLDDINTVIGPVPDDPDETIQNQLKVIRDKVSPDLTILNPKYVWAAQFDHRTWFDWPGGTVGEFGVLEKRQSAELFLSAYNPSLQETKVRVQGTFGSLVIIEHDILVPAGQHRALLSNVDALYTWRDNNHPIPNVLLLSSDTKVVIRGSTVLHQREFRFSQISAQSNYNSYGIVHDLNFQILDCTDLVNNAHACRTPLTESHWETFVPE